MGPYRVAVIFLHPACNMSCSFCITEDDFDAMTYLQAVELLGKLKEEGFENIVLGGGEPFDWSGDLLALSREAKRLGFFVQVGTNAVALPKDFESIESIDRYVLPLESSKDVIHNKMRFYKNKHHQVILDSLGRLRAAQKSVTLSTIITKVNKDELGALAIFLKILGTGSPFIHAWHLYKFIPQGRGGGVNADFLMLSDEEYIRVSDEVGGLGLPFDVFKRRDMYHSKTVDFFWLESGKLRRASECR